VKIPMKKTACGLTCLLLLSATLMAKDPGNQSVDSGAFGIFVNNRRVATETFSVQKQSNGNSVITSQIKDDGGTAAQNSELQLTSAGALVSYEWHESAPNKTSLKVAPDGEFLRQTVIEKPGEKPTEQPYLLPATSPVLDNNFFVHREILAWRYMGSSCTSETAGLKCGPGEFGVLVPQGRSSYHLSIQPVGDEKRTIGGVEKTLLRIDLKGDDGEWSLWLNTKDHYKLMRVTKAGEQVEVVRD
jgi:hypothetical protein